MTRIRRGGFIFLTWTDDHSPRHVHVYRDGELVVKWDLESSKPMKGKATRRILRLVDELEPVDEPEAGFRPVRSYFFWPLGGAFALAAFMAVISLLNNLAVRRVYRAQTDVG